MRPESLAGHLYIPGTKKKFRVWYDKIVDFKSFSDRFGIMRVAQSAKPRSFRTGDGWFAFNLAVNLGQMGITIPDPNKKKACLEQAPTCQH